MAEIGGKVGHVGYYSEPDCARGTDNGRTMKDKDLEEVTDDSYCRDKFCEDHDWRQSQVERDGEVMTLSFYCTKCLCLTFMNFNMEHEHEHIHDEEEDILSRKVN